MYVLRSIWTLAVYFCTLLYIGVSLWRTAVVCTIVLICLALRYFERWVEKLGFALLLIAAAVWLQVIPTIDQWPDLASTAWQYLKAATAHH